MTKKYEINFSFNIGERGMYNSVVKFSGSENVPDEKDPVAYLRERIGAEIKRICKDVEFESDGV